MFCLSDYAFDLPDSLIAQVPCHTRSDSRLMHLSRDSHTLGHHRFEDLTRLLVPGDLLVVNNTRVIPARLQGTKETGGRVEVLISDYVTGMTNLSRSGAFQCDCLVRASRAPKPGTRIDFGPDMSGRVIRATGGVCEIRFDGGDQFPRFLQRCGTLPLPPYIHRTGTADHRDMDRDRYQTVYSQADGAVAAPTAGLHFTPELLERLAQQGIGLARITLHVGYGTFVPVRVDDIRDHSIHGEYYSVTEDAARQINGAKQEGRRVVAVGTTSVRTLEYLSDESGRIRPGSGVCDLYIYPGFRYRCVDAMITNFHLPGSTLLMLVSAFYDRVRVLSAYREAVAREYRFFSYGDAMLIT